MSAVSSRTALTARRRASILDAALECFTTRGYAATTIEEIRQRSGASVGSVYHHFGSKEEIAATLYVEGLAGFQEGFLAELRAHPEAEEGVKAGVRFHLRWVAEHPDLARFLLTRREPEVAEASRDMLRERNRPFFRHVFSWLDRHVDEGQIRRLPRDLYPVLWTGPAQELARLWTSDRIRIRPEEAADHLASAAWDTLKAVE